MDDHRPRELADLASVEDPVLDQLPDGTALSTFGTYSTASTTSCPVSSAGSAMTAS
ncbi:thiocillin family RiPP [Nocardioides zeae]